MLTRLNGISLGPRPFALAQALLRHLGRLQLQFPVPASLHMPAHPTQSIICLLPLQLGSSSSKFKHNSGYLPPHLFTSITRITQTTHHNSYNLEHQPNSAISPSYNSIPSIHLSSKAIQYQLLTIPTATTTTPILNINSQHHHLIAASKSL